jgi:hypothetical protein
MLTRRNQQLHRDYQRHDIDYPHEQTGKSPRRRARASTGSSYSLLFAMSPVGKCSHGRRVLGHPTCGTPAIVIP